jgi:FlaA1/EpsC-like NDP-sugar epimerase
MKQTFFIVLPLQAIAFLSFGLYRGTWRFASLPDLKRIFLAVTHFSNYLGSNCSL